MINSINWCNVDKVCDFIPVVSTFSTIANVCIEIFNKPTATSSDKYHHYYEHIQDKSKFRTILLAIPGVNFVVAILHLAYTHVKKVQVNATLLNNADLIDKMKRENILFVREYNVANAFYGGVDVVTVGYVKDGGVWRRCMATSLLQMNSPEAWTVTFCNVPQNAPKKSDQILPAQTVFLPDDCLAGLDKKTYPVSDNDVFQVAIQRLNAQTRKKNWYATNIGTVHMQSWAGVRKKYHCGFAEQAHTLDFVGSD